MEQTLKIIYPLITSCPTPKNLKSPGVIQVSLIITSIHFQMLLKVVPEEARKEEATKIKDLIIAVITVSIQQS